MIKIGIIGTHGTRKTSLGLYLAARFKEKGVDAGFMDEVARRLPRSPGFNINEGTTRESQLWIAHTQIKEELEYWARGDVNPLFTDRSIFDNYMYYFYWFGRDNPQMDAFVENWTKTYNLLVKMPILENKSVDVDPVRAKSLDFQMGIDRLLEEQLEKRSIPFLRYRTTEEIIEKVMLLLNRERNIKK